VGTEIILTIVKEVLAPAVLGRSAEATSLRYTDMYETMRVRGQIGGYQQDAIAGLDTALWDLRGRAVHASIADLLGGRRDSLPAYVTGLREKTPKGRRAEAADWAAQGLGVKPCLGLGAVSDGREVEGLRSAMGDDATLLVDGMWGYTYPEAIRAGRVFEQYGVGFLEAPLLPEDVRGHALAAELDLPIAVGEPLRTRFQFLPWFQAEAVDIAQPDLMRNGVTETTAIGELAQAFNLPVALHTGVVTVVGMAASWQVASTIRTFHIQELQPVMLTTFNPWIAEPLRIFEGAVEVPTGPGLGIESTRSACAGWRRTSSPSPCATSRDVEALLGAATTRRARPRRVSPVGCAERPSVVGGLRRRDGFGGVAGRPRVDPPAPACPRLAGHRGGPEP